MKFHTTGGQDLQSEFEYVLKESLSPGKSPGEEQKGEAASPSAVSSGGAFCASQGSVWYIWQARGGCAAEIGKSFHPGIPDQGQVK